MDDLNKIPAQNDAQELVTLQDQLDTALASNNPDGAQAVVAELQDQIEQLRADQVNVLQELQAKAACRSRGPRCCGNLLPAVAGGLLLGVLAALVLAESRGGSTPAQDVADKVGLRTLVELPRPGNKAGRARQAAAAGAAGQHRQSPARRSGGGGRGAARARGSRRRSSPGSWRASGRAQGHPTVLVDTGVRGILDGRGSGWRRRMRPGTVCRDSRSSSSHRGPSTDAPALSRSAR